MRNMSQKVREMPHHFHILMEFEHRFRRDIYKANYRNVFESLKGMEINQEILFASQKKNQEQI